MSLFSPFSTRRIREAPLALLLALASCSGSTDQTQPLTVGSVPFSAGEIGAPVAPIESPGGHGAVAVVHGHLMVIHSSDAGGSAQDGGIEFWDLTGSAVAGPGRES